MNWEFGISRAASKNSEAILGHGYDMTGRYADVFYIRAPVLNYNKLVADSLVTLLTNVQDVSRYESTSGNNASEYQEALTEKLGVEANASYGAASFSTEVGKAFNSTKVTSINYSFNTIRYRQPTEITYITATKYLLDTSYLDANFKAALAKLQSGQINAKNLIQTFGTHVMWGGIWGARFDYNTTVMRKSTEESVDISNYAKAKAAATFGALSVGGGVSQEAAEATSSKIHEETKKTGHGALGGNPNLSGVVEDAATFNNWVASIDTSNKVWIDYYTGMGGGPAEITYFIENPALKKLVQDSLDAYYIAKGVIIGGEDAPPSHDVIVDLDVNELRAPNEQAQRTTAYSENSINTHPTSGAVGWSMEVRVSSPGGTTLTVKVGYAVEEYKGDKTRLYFEKTYNLDLVALGAIKSNERIPVIREYQLDWVYGYVSGQHEDYVSGNYSSAYVDNLWARVDGPGNNDDFNINLKAKLYIPVTTVGSLL